MLIDSIRLLKLYHIPARQGSLWLITSLLTIITRGPGFGITILIYSAKEITHENSE